MYRTFLILSICTLLLVSCDEEPTTSLVPDSNENLTPIAQGVYGRVLFWEGDFMPTYPEGDSGGEIYPVVRDVCIFEAVRYDDIEWSYVELEPGYDAHVAAAVPSDLVRITWSNPNGYFGAELPPGRYSIFVREHGYYYANLVDWEGYVFPVEVDEGEAVGVQFDITYMATY